MFVGVCVKVASRLGRFMTLADAGKLKFTVALHFSVTNRPIVSHIFYT